MLGGCEGWWCWVDVRGGGVGGCDGWWGSVGVGRM